MIDHSTGLKSTKQRPEKQIHFSENLILDEKLLYIVSISGSNHGKLYLIFISLILQFKLPHKLRAMRQNQTINPLPQSRQIGKGGGILNTLYEIGYWNRIITFKET